MELENSSAGIRQRNLAKQLAANASEVSYAALRLRPPIIMGNLNVMYALCMLSLSTPYDVHRQPRWHLPLGPYTGPRELELCLQ